MPRLLDRVEGGMTTGSDVGNIIRLLIAVAIGACVVGAVIVLLIK